VVDACPLWGGVASDLPVVGDWTGAGTTKIGIYRPSTGTFYLDLNGNGVYEPGTDATYPDWGGWAGDVPVVGDWNGDGRMEIGIFRASTHTFYLDLNGNGVYEPGTDVAIAWGNDPSDVPVVGDWTGTGVTRVGIYRQGTGMWYLDLDGNGSFDEVQDIAIALGGFAGDKPVVGGWSTP
jgi:hypothetical protein